MADLIGRTIKLFLVDGAPDGTLTAEIMNWTGHVLYAPRSRIVDILKRPESGKTGVYLLIGRDPSKADELLVYVGQSDNVGTRLASHNKDPEKEFWENVCIVTSKDLNLTTAHVRYLEGRLVALVAGEARAKLINKNEPSYDLLPEADRSDMEDFIARLQILLPVLGIQFIRPTPNISKMTVAPRESAAILPNTFELAATPDIRASSTRARPTAEGAKSPVFRFSAGGLVARAVEIGGQMVVLAKSQAKAVEQESLGSNVRTYRDQLRRSGKLVPMANTDVLEFAEDIAFTSPSAAAQAVMGTSRNGRIDWIVEDTGLTYADWQEAAVSSAQAVAPSEVVLN